MSQQRQEDGVIMLPARDENELRLIDVWHILARQKMWVIVLPIIFGLAAAAYVLLVKTQWEATAVIQIGHVGRGIDQAGTPIESVAQTVERIKIVAFRNAVLQQLKIPLNQNNPSARLYRDSINVKQLPNTNLIELKVRGFSPKDAERSAEATAKHLQNVHQHLAQRFTDQLKVALSDTTADLQESEDERTALSASLKSKVRADPGNRVAESVLWANLLASKDSEIRKLKQRKLALKDELSPANTYPTSIIGDVYVPVEPVFPKKIITVVLAVILGLILGIFVAFIIDNLRRQWSSTS